MKNSPKISNGENIIGIIPARMASSRFPGKPLKKILGKPMIEHVSRRSKMSKALNDVYIATCDQEIYDFCQANSMKVVMTSPEHERPSGRTAEALEKIELKTGQKADIVVMIQGDEPMVVPEMIDLAIEPLREDPSVLVSNLMAPLKTQAEHEDLNEPKVVIDKNNFALYFSREPIPSRKKGATNIKAYKQVCIIPFQRDFLLKFNQLESTPLEKIESIDMLRIMEHGYKVKMIMSPYDSYSVDTPNDLIRVEKLMQNDSLLSIYI